MNIMKRIFPIVMLAAGLTACTPQEVSLFNQVNGTNHPLPPAATDRATLLELPETLVTATECGTERNVIAWYGPNGEAHGDFVYEDEAGARWIYTASSFGCGYHWLLTDAPCSYDGFNGVVGTDCEWPTP